MVKSLKVFMYKPEEAEFKLATKVESLFYSLLQNSTYITQDPEEAHLFFVPFSPNISRRALARFIARVRTEFPYWNRALGSDHFYLSCAGIPPESDRNLVELKKNAIQISCFPTRHDKFVPHKDVTLPPLPEPHSRMRRVRATTLVNDTEAHAGRLDGGGEFCVGESGNDASWIGEALRLGCVPVVVTEGPVNDMPFMDVLRWGDIAVFVRSGEGVTRVLGDTWRVRHERIKGLGVVASKHFQWNHPPLPFDAFNTIMYQLWLRRHTVRYATMQ
ncbi:probable glycosyltransferase At5g03795 [Abrus precatorius]|uniref:Probable glycosyltransferase At5g03795 n=1 Tax=Abrus precatorius TaxID=3816 RepID=A0A8B8JTL4_ABRPR|nr:probable glycosyltransferase At5g03795 [Abrus precatorius]